MLPLFVFDREVVPPGTEVTGRIVSLDPVARDEDLAERRCVDHIKAAAIAALDMIERSTAKEKA